MIIVGEIKLDETFRNGEFPVDNFHLWRADRTANGGGLLVYIRSDLACMRKNKLECEHIESIFTEISFKDKKWLICGLYRPPPSVTTYLLRTLLKHLTTSLQNMIILL